MSRGYISNCQGIPMSMDKWKINGHISSYTSFSFCGKMVLDGAIKHPCSVGILFISYMVN